MSTVDRATFVGTSAATMTLAAGAPASAQADFGKPHPPLVAEDDPAITVVRPQLPTGIPAYAAMPKNVTPTTPGIVQVMAIWGIDAQLRDVIRRYAKAGYICIAPDMASHWDGDKAALNRGDVGLTLTDDQVIGYYSASLDYLLASKDVDSARVAAMGVCQSGGYPLLLNSERISSMPASRIIRVASANTASTPWRVASRGSRTALCRLMPTCRSSPISRERRLDPSHLRGPKHRLSSIGHL